MRREAAAEAPLDERGALGGDWRYGDFIRDARSLGIKKKYHPPATPFQRLLADTRTSEDARSRVKAIYANLDPWTRFCCYRRSVRLRHISSKSPTVRSLAKRTLRPRRPSSNSSPACAPRHRVAGWRGASDQQAEGKGLARPASSVTLMVREWFEVEPWRTSRELFERLQGERPGSFPTGSYGRCSAG